MIYMERKIKKLSIVIPVYYNELNLCSLYDDLKEKVFNRINYDYELVFVDDGSKDSSWDIINKLKKKDNNILAIRLSRNFGSHAAILCGISNCSGDCVIVKSADLQEPSEIIHNMVSEWELGANVVLAVRNSREERWIQSFFANLYYDITRKLALHEMPRGGFDVYLVDRKVIDVLARLDETNSALTGQILWSGFRTKHIYYNRLAREKGQSRWTMRKKIKLVADTLFSFSVFPIKVVSGVGFGSVVGAIIWAVVELALKLEGKIEIQGWTMLFVFCLFAFGTIMFTLGILGNYIWRIFDASRNRPPYIVEDFVKW